METELREQEAGLEAVQASVGETRAGSDRAGREGGCIRERAESCCKESGGPGFSSLSDGE